MPLKKEELTGEFYFQGKDINLGTELYTGANPQSNTGSGGTQVQQNNYNITGDGTFQSGNFFGDVTAAFKFLESEQLGNIIASPNVIVREGQQGRIQVGSDFSVKQRDFAGNVVEKFFPTGTIIEVTPYRLY